MSAWIASTYSTSSDTGFVSSKRRWQRPPNSRASSKFSVIGSRVADVQVAVGLGRKARDDRSAVLAAGDLALDQLADEVAGAAVGPVRVAGSAHRRPNLIEVTREVLRSQPPRERRRRDPLASGR